MTVEPFNKSSKRGRNTKLLDFINYVEYLDIFLHDSKNLIVLKLIILQITKGVPIKFVRYKT